MSGELKIRQYVRKSFLVDAIRVTPDNLEAVAEWCGGTIQERMAVSYIKVQVANPINDRQTEAFPGDWVLYAGKGFKVYKDAPFRKSFDEPTDTPQVKENNVFTSETNPTVSTSFSSGPNPGGTTSV